ncbi:MAG: hypothetical protein KC620_19150 [Myxococcales bacterium]|nr:hypothetical protein [Myxococcales bacterium]
MNRWIAAVLIAGATPSAPLLAHAAQSAAETQYYAGLEALRAERFHEALGLFEQALAAGGSDELRASILRAYGHAAGKVVEADRDLACRSVGYYRDWLMAAAPDDSKRADVMNAMGDMQRLCNADTAPGPVSDRSAELWVLVGGASAALVGGVVSTALMFSKQSDYDAAAADARQAGNAARQQALVDKLAGIDGDIETLESVSVGFYVAAGLMAAGAAWVWWSSPSEGSAVSVAVAPGMVGIGGHW